MELLAVASGATASAVADNFRLAGMSCQTATSVQRQRLAMLFVIDQLNSNCMARCAYPGGLSTRLMSYRFSCNA